MGGLEVVEESSSRISPSARLWWSLLLLAPSWTLVPLIWSLVMLDFWVSSATIFLFLFLSLFAATTNLGEIPLSLGIGWLLLFGMGVWPRFYSETSDLMSPCRSKWFYCSRPQPSLSQACSCIFFLKNFSSFTIIVVSLFCPCFHAFGQLPWLCFNLGWLCFNCKSSRCQWFGNLNWQYHIENGIFSIWWR